VDQVVIVDVPTALGGHPHHPDAVERLVGTAFEPGELRRGNWPEPDGSDG